VIVVKEKGQALKKEKLVMRTVMKLLSEIAARVSLND